MNGINPPTEEIKEEIKTDMKMIEESIQSNDCQRMRDTHFYIDGKYHTCIFEWGNSMYGYLPDYGFDPSLLDEESLKHNLNVMKANLAGLSLGLNSYIYPENPSDDRRIESGITLNVNNSNNNSNSINLNLSFDQARQQVEEMTTLNRQETDEIIEKIDEIESISKEKEPKKKKWEKIKPILLFALDKGVDIAIMLWSLALQGVFGK